MQVNAILRACGASVGLSLLCFGNLLAQTQGFHVHPNGLVQYDWSNMDDFRIGDTLRVGAVLINASDSVIDAPFAMCDFEASTSVPLRVVRERCSDPSEMLLPGDSLFAERWWEVLGPPGEYEWELVAPWGRRSVSAWRVHAREGAEGKAFAPMPRVPIVLSFSVSPDASVLQRSELEHAIRHVVWSAGFFPVIASRQAAVAMAVIAPYLFLDVSITGRTDVSHAGRFLRYDVAACWIRADLGEAPPCSSRGASGSAGVPVFTLLLAGVLENELRWFRRVQLGREGLNGPREGLASPN